MRKRIVLILAMLLLAVTNMNCIEVLAEELAPLNPVLDVGDKIYVQHAINEETGDIYSVYDLQKSGTGTTVVYETILPEFAASKAWLTDGEYISLNPGNSSFRVGATVSENYIPVTAGEEYFIKTYGLGYYGNVTNEDGSTTMKWYAPVLFLDDQDNVKGHELSGTLSKSKTGVTITVPEGATKMHLTVFNNQSFTLQKVLYLSDTEFDLLPINRTQLEASFDETYEAYVQDKTVYRKPDKACITFVNDDTRPAIDTYADLFMEKNVPLVLATVPELLIDNASSGEETKLEVARRVEQAGGEIIAHNGGVLTKEGLTDYNTMYSFFVRTKQLFNYYDFDVNGIILSGGTGLVSGAKESERWVSSLYSYSDLYGTQYDRKDIALDSVYFHSRGGLSNFGSNIDKIKQSIDEAIAQNAWAVYYFHDSSEINTEVLSQVLDYVNEKSAAGELEVVTYKEMYQKYAAKESDIINTKTTYYVSATGTSKTGTSASDPMSYETANSKTFLSGDTILLKRDDIFYGTFAPTISKVDDSITTISAYGEGARPKISGYKIADSESSWQLEAEGIYKINLTDTSCFSGLGTTDAGSVNIGFLEDENGTKYYNKKSALTELEEENDFYCDDTYLYIKSDENPYSKLGELKLATKTNLFWISSNVKVSNLELCGTGAHGMTASDTTVENVEISKNIIQDIGGSYLKGTTRYGNGIEFYSSDVSNVVVKSNIIRNVYDVGFTMQGTKGSGKEVVVKGNVFVNNSQDSEIWENGSATGIESYEFTNNISVNEGRGWGYEARPDKYVAAHILFWGYNIENTDIYFHHNTVYHPRRLYFVEQTYGTNLFFKENDYIRSDYNTYLLAEDAKLFRDDYSISEKDDFIAEYCKDENSEFTQIEADEELIEKFASSDDIVSLKAVFGYEEEPDDDDFTDDDDNREEDNKEEDSKRESVSGNELEVVEGAPSEIRVGKIVISAPSKKLAAGKKVQLGIEVSPANATNPSVTWKSSKPKYATVSRTGKVTLKKAGIGKTVTITAEASDGSGVKATYKIKIMKHAVKKITLTADKKTVKAGKSIKLKAIVTTTGESANKALKWTSSNTEYATVSKNGKVTTKKAGKGKTVTITATATDGSAKKAKMKIKIK